MNTRAEPAVDDFIFSRPRQSEFVLLPFGPLLLLRGGDEIVGEWEVGF